MALGLGCSITVGRLVGGAGGAAVVIEDYMWEIATSGELTPLASGTVNDFHDTWDLDGTNNMPQTEATVGAEGYWELDGTNIQPLDV